MMAVPHVDGTVVVYIAMSSLRELRQAINRVPIAASAIHIGSISTYIYATALRLHTEMIVTLEMVRVALSRG